MIDKNIFKLSTEQINSLFTEEERKTREKFMQELEHNALNFIEIHEQYLNQLTKTLDGLRNCSERLNACSDKFEKR